MSEEDREVESHRDKVSVAAARSAYRERNKEKIRLAKHLYYMKNRERIAEEKKLFNARNRDKISARRKLYYQKNREAILERNRTFYKKYYEHNREGISIKSRRKYQQKKLSVLMVNSVQNDESIIQNLLLMLPEFKRAPVNEFISKYYKHRKMSSKLRLLRNLNMLVAFMSEKSPGSENGGWNLVTLVDVERCQIEARALFECTRVFFRWLYKRKRIGSDLSQAIRPKKSQIRAPLITHERLRMLYERWHSNACDLLEKISGLLIMYYGLTNRELRYLECGDFENSRMRLGNESFEIDAILWSDIQEYLSWRRRHFFGAAPKYFFVTNKTVIKQQPLCKSFFSRYYRSKGLNITPKYLRTTMIFFLKQGNFDAFALGKLFRISPEGASRYFKIM